MKLCRYFRAAVVFDTADWHEDADRVAGLDGKYANVLTKVLQKDFEA